MRVILIGVGIFLPLFSVAQQKEATISSLLDSAELYQYVNYEKTIHFTESAEKLISIADHSENASHLIRANQIKINSSNAFSRIQLSRQYLENGSQLIDQFRVQLGSSYDSIKMESKLSWAEFFYLINDITKSLAIYTEAFADLKQFPQSKDNCQKLYRTAQFIASLENRQGEFEAAINQYLASLPYYECYRDKSLPENYVLAYRNIGQVYLEKKDYNKAREYFDKAEASLKSYIEKKPKKPMPASTIITLYENIATYYRIIGKYDSAWVVFQRAIPFVAQHEPSRGRFYHYLGGVNEGIGKPHAANENYLKSVDFYLKFFGSKNIRLSRSYFSLGGLREKQGDSDQAMEYYQKSIVSLVLNFESKDANPPLENILSKKYLFSSLQAKSRLQEKSFHKKNQVALLKLAFDTNQLSLALLDSTANEFSLDADKIILSEQSYSAFEDGVRISNALYQKTGDEKYFTHVISLIEKSKGNLLLENLRLVNRFSGIKQEWLDREKELKAELLLMEQTLYEDALNNGNTGELQQTRERYATVKRDYSSLIEQIKSEAPDYYKLRFDHSVVSTENIQHQLLNPNEALVEFFVGDSILAVAGFTKDKKYLTVKKMPPDFTEKMNQFRTILTTSNSDFVEQSKELYNFLLKDCLAELGTEINSLIIVPDGLLGYLPFEVLIQSKQPKIMFLNDIVSIHYANSATYLIEQIQRKPSDSKNFFAGFVSSSQSTGNQAATRDQQLEALQGAEHEVASITALFSSKFDVFNPADKVDFINHASDYKILHFAMHSLLNDENPMMSVMVFSGTDSSKNLLTANELYSMKLNSDLAVLSACNTGVGQLHRGEGIMSFSRAFAYAGVPSAVISLWKVPDIATSKIMVSFYSHLKNGLSKDKALQLARQDFVRDNPAMAHPFFWSGFILTGNAEAITFPASSWWIWIVLISVVVLIGLYFVRRRQIQNSKPSHSL